MLEEEPRCAEKQAEAQGGQPLIQGPVANKWLSWGMPMPPSKVSDLNYPTHRLTSVTGPWDSTK